MSRATAGGTLDDLRTIAAESVKRNEADGVTGLLLYDGERYLQAIEGVAEAVAHCFERIKSDRRHFDVRVAAQEAINGREFGSWSMLARAAPAAGSADFLQEVMACVTTVSNPHLKALFIGFASLRHRAP